jgi:hypothetical protein
VGVSESHIRLVNALKVYVEERFGGNGKLIVYSDNPDSAFTCKVPLIGGAFPDLYARCYSPDMVILGEAKTVNDVENRHSIGQYRSYLEFCANRENALLVFAVPWTVVPSLKNTIRNLKRRMGTEGVEILFIEPLPE